MYAPRLGESVKTRSPRRICVRGLTGARNAPLVRATALVRLDVTGAHVTSLGTRGESAYARQLRCEHQVSVRERRIGAQHGTDAATNRRMQDAPVASKMRHPHLGSEHSPETNANLT